MPSSFRARDGLTTTSPRRRRRARGVGTGKGRKSETVSSILRVVFTIRKCEEDEDGATARHGTSGLGGGVTTGRRRR